MFAHISAGEGEITWKTNAAIALIIESEVVSTTYEQLQLLVNIFVLFKNMF